MFVYPRGINAFWNFQINFCSVLFCSVLLNASSVLNELGWTVCILAIFCTFNVRQFDNANDPKGLMRR